jgi:hypothetical protein
MHFLVRPALHSLRNPTQAEHHYAKAQRREAIGQERMAKLEQQRAEWEREKLLEEVRRFCYWTINKHIFL